MAFCRPAFLYVQQIPSIREAPDLGNWKSDINTAVYKRFKDHDAAFSLGADELVGCTCLFVVGRKGVYAAHWWENLSFSPGLEWLNRKLGKKGGLETDEEVFDRTVLTALRRGTTHRGQLTHHELPSDIGDECVKAYLIRPKDSYDNVLDGHRDKWNSIKNVVCEIVPRLTDKNRWEEVIYRPQNLSHDDLIRGANVKILVSTIQVSALEVRSIRQGCELRDDCDHTTRTTGDG